MIKIRRFLLQCSVKLNPEYQNTRACNCGSYYSVQVFEQIAGHNPQAVDLGEQVYQLIARVATHLRRDIADLRATHTCRGGGTGMCRLCCIIFPPLITEEKKKKKKVGKGGVALFALVHVCECMLCESLCA